MKRFGLVAIKVGCSTYFKSDGTAIAVTVLKVANSFISSFKKKEVDGYNGMQIVYDKKVVRESVIAKPILGALKKLNLPLLRYSKEFVFDHTNINISELVVGSELSASIFSGVKKVDITGYTKGKGFSGVMKRYKFSGLNASHGVSLSHRMPGSTGQRTDPGKVFKNKKMAGRHGMYRKTIHSMSIVSIDEANNIIIVKGSVPGSMNDFIFIREVAKF
jgi:large subunit ribosomal protein L3